MKINIAECVKPSESMKGWFTESFRRQVLATLSSCLMALCCGLTFGISAVMLPQLRTDEQFQYDSSADSWVASITTLSMFFGAFSVGSILDMAGRKKSHIILSLPYIIGWCMIALANSTNIILAGRFITGISSGANRPLALVYCGEISSPRYRPVFLFMPSLATLLGILLVHTIGCFVNWRVVALLCMIPAFACSIIVCFLKESPLWLISKGRIEEGIETFRWFRGTDDASEKELASVLSKQVTKISHFKHFCDVLFSRSFIKPMFILVLLMMNIQYSGVNVIQFYAQDMYDLIFSAKVDSVTIMLALDGVRILVSTIVILLSNKLPRKVTLTCISVGVSTTLVILVVYVIWSPVVPTWVPILALFLYMSFVSGILTVAWSFVPEILPTKVRGFGTGLTSASSYILLFSAVKITPDVMNNYGIEYLFGIFAVSTIICTTLLYFLLPDTSGKTLQTIEDEFIKEKTRVIEQSKL